MLLALAVALAGVSVDVWADDDPDLEVKHLGAGSAPEFQRFEVKNVGKEKSPKTTLTVETLRPGSANEKAFDVPALDKGKAESFSQILDLVVPMVHNADYEKDGLILIGASEEMNNDRAACMSEVSSIELTFTYVIPDR